VQLKDKGVNTQKPTAEDIYECEDSSVITECGTRQPVQVEEKAIITLMYIRMVMLVLSDIAMP
jgi:hypothetical protein